MGSHKTFFVALSFDDSSVNESCLCAESLKTLEVLVYGANAEVAASGEGNLCLA